ncbi:MAG TPA: universal stress protein [Bacteroidales bacterium]|nr:universal stress protein [Bacteroidales bacterium]
MNIIIATDLSEFNDNLLPYAIDIIKHTGGSLILYHAIVDHVILGDPGLPGMLESEAYLNRELMSELEEQSLKHMEQKAAILSSMLLAAGLDKVELKTIVKGGDPENDLAELASEYSANLILMGTRGKGRKAFLEGNMARRIMQKINIPLLIIPEGYNFRENNKILYATSLNKNDKAAIEFILELLDPFDPELHVVHLLWDISKQEPVLRMELLRQNFIKEVNLGKVRFDLIPARNAREDLKTYCAAHDISMASFIANKRSWLDYIFPGKVGKNDFFALGLPMLTFRFDQEMRP